MEETIFREISLRGRISYGIMCAEKYVLSKYPNKQWKPLFQKLWAISGDIYWDDWSSSIIEIIPEYLFEFPDYESSGFELLTLDEYATFVNLLKDTDNQLNKILKSIRCMEEEYAYTEITDHGEKTLCHLLSIINILKSENITLPIVEKVAFSSFSEFNGRGNPFNAKFLSMIL